MSIGTQISQHVDVRLADPLTEPVVDWCQANSERNAFDKDVLAYPSTKVLAAHNNGTVFNYMPLQGTAMLESVGPNPEASKLQVAQGIMECAKAAGILAYAAGYRELYFLSSDELTAAGAKLIGFEELPFKVYRKRL